MRRLPDASPRGRAITVDLEGEAIPAVEGEPVACSLIAAGETVLARSIKYHRPRGAFCFAAACSHCLMRVDGQPNVYTCRTPARAGMKLERQNAFPSAKVDLFGTIDWFFPNRFDHHTMLAGVPVAEQVMAKVARQLAGLGLLPDHEAPIRPHAQILRADVVVVGGGPAGLAAARVLTERRIPFFLVEREERLGGRLIRGALQPADPSVADEPPLPPSHVMTRAHAIGLYDDERGRFLAVVKVEPEGPRLLRVYADRFLLAPGGHPALLPFENNDLPGVYAGRAASMLLRAHDVAPETAALVGWGEELHALGRLLEASGTQVRAVVDLRGPLPMDVLPVACVGSEPKAHGLRKVTAFSFQKAGQRVKVDCDAVLVSIPTSPSFELARQGGASVSFDAERGLFVVEADADGRTAAPHLFVAGDITGGGSAREAAAAGARAAEAIIGGRS
jgi:sarcosine oxidase subunit alpha